MKIVVPLAGPDFERADGTVKAEYSVDGLPLLRRSLESRPWWRKLAGTEDLTFVLRDAPVLRKFSDQSLAEWFPGSQRVFLSRTTRGAALTALAGVALQADAEEVVCIDLADILFECVDDVSALFSDPQIGAAVLTFASQSDVFSYLRRDEAGEVVEAAEKRVMSNEASAGVYLFSRPAVYLRAVAHALDNRAGQTFNSLFFVCPLVNGILAQSLRVIGLPVAAARAIKM